MNVRRMNLSFLAVIAVTCTVIAGACGENVYQINKCCPEGEILDTDLNCVEISDGSMEEVLKSRDMAWFPFDTIVDSKTMKIHQHRRREYEDIIKEKYHVNYGNMVRCDEDDEKQISLHSVELVQWFNFIMDDDGSMRVHISKPSSFHDPENGIPVFETINSVSEAIPSAIDAGSVRTLPLNDTCVDIGKQQLYIVLYCPCQAMLCIRKCCMENQYFSIESSTCEKNELEDRPRWRPKLEDGYEKYYLLSNTYPSCEEPMILKSEKRDYSSCERFNKASDNEFTIYPNGSLKINKYKKLYGTKEYCGEITVSEKGFVEEQNFLLCGALKKKGIYERYASAIYGGLSIVGGICLFLTVAVSLFLPSLRRKVHNKIALSHNVSLMIASFAYAIPRLFSLSIRTCSILVIIQQFTILGSFFWLNVMCIDISMTFSSTRHLQRGRFDGGWKKFILYSIYAWGCPVLISTFTVIVELVPNLIPNNLRPGFLCSCIFENWAVLIYLYAPMVFILLMNLVLYVYTTVKIIKIQKQTAMLHKTDSKTSGGSSFQSDKQRMILYGKLFLLMGVTWITEIISWAVGGPVYIWYFSDILNLLRAVFIFILFICKRDVLGKLRKQWKRQSTGHTGSSRSQTDEIALSVQENCHDGLGNGGRRKNSRQSQSGLSRKSAETSVPVNDSLL